MAVPPLDALAPDLLEPSAYRTAEKTFETGRTAPLPERR